MSHVFKQRQRCQQTLSLTIMGEIQKTIEPTYIIYGLGFTSLFFARLT